MSDIVTAAMIVIGDEILSGRTRDRNIGHLASVLTAVGIDLVEVRIVADDTGAIVEAVNILRQRCDYVFTTGGIGPTHDDITAESVSQAFNLPCGYDEQAYTMLEQTYADRGMKFSDARKRMARMPEGAHHIANPVSVAPGFVIENVHVMAGVPAIFQAMLDNVLPTLKTGSKLVSETVHCPHGEGTIGEGLGKIQEAFPETIIGSYPKFEDGKFWTEIVIRARDSEPLATAKSAVVDMLADLERISAK